MKIIFQARFGNYFEVDKQKFLKTKREYHDKFEVNNQVFRAGVHSCDTACYIVVTRVVKIRLSKENFNELVISNNNYDRWEAGKEKFNLSENEVLIDFDSLTEEQKQKVLENKAKSEVKNFGLIVSPEMY